MGTEGSKHSTAATLERVDSQAAVLPQAFKDRVHARQLAGVVQESGAKDESSRFGTLTFNMTHVSERGAAARKKSKSDPHCSSRKVCRISFHTHVQHVHGWTKGLGTLPRSPYAKFARTGSSRGLSFQGRVGNVAEASAGFLLRTGSDSVVHNPP